MLAFDRQQLANAGPGYRLVGVDEVGRGALAGPVTAAAVSLDTTCFTGAWEWPTCQRVDDSKKLSPAQRQAIAAEIEGLKRDGYLHGEVGMASVAEIEEYNIVGATCLAMSRALAALEQALQLPVPLPRYSPLPLLDRALLAKPGVGQSRVCILVDGRPMKALPYIHRGIVRGDNQSLSIALASIYAKVTRDAYMICLDEEHPHYGFAAHKGYGTPFHRRAITELGRLPHHRAQFLCWLSP